MRALPYSKPLLRLTRSMYASIAPAPEEKQKPIYSPPISAPSQIFTFSNGPNTHRKNGANSTSKVVIIHSRCFLSPACRKSRPAPAETQ